MSAQLWGMLLVSDRHLVLLGLASAANLYSDGQRSSVADWRWSSAQGRLTLLSYRRIVWMA